MKKNKKIVSASLVIPVAASSMSFGFASQNAEAAEIVEIYTAQDLLNISSNLAGQYKLMNDIDLSGIDWQPLGIFSGSLDGNGFTVKNLSVNFNANNAGLFSQLSNASVKNIKFSNVTVSNTGNYTGALAGLVKGLSVIEQVSVENGTVKGKAYTGGLIGAMNGNNTREKVKAVNVHSSADIEGTSNVGGLIGIVRDAELTNAYATGNVIGSLDNIGGLIGNNDMFSIISNTFATGDVTGRKSVGGLVGNQYSSYVDANLSGTIQNSYATGNVTGDSSVGGVVGNNGDGTVNNVFALNEKVTSVDNTTYGKAIGSGSGSNVYIPETMEGLGGTNSITGLLTNEEVFQQATYNGFDFTNTWEMDAASGLPVLKFAPKTLEKPVLGTKKTSLIHDGTIYSAIYSAQDLQNISNDVKGYYLLMNDIDLEGITWQPIGNKSAPFAGKLNADSHKITNLNLDTTVDYAGLFGYMDTAEVKNLELANVSIKNTRNYTGALAGIVQNKSIIDNVGVTSGSVEGKDSTGGLIGYSKGYSHDAEAKVSNVYSLVNVTGTSKVGGLIGHNENTNLNNAYATGDVTGMLDEVGGLIGNNALNSYVENVFATGDVSGRKTVGGLVGNQNSAYVDTNLGGLIQNAYATGNVSGEGNVGGVIGHNQDGIVNNVFALNGRLNSVDPTTYGKAIGVGSGNNVFIPETMNGIGGTHSLTGLLTNEEVTSQETYAAFDFTNTWGMDSESGLPILKFAPISVETPVLGNVKTSVEHDGKVFSAIYSAQDLYDVRKDMRGHYLLMNDINLSGIDWEPIGDKTYNFSGVFDGNDQVIANLSMDRSVDYAGLFGYGSSVDIKNLTLSNVNIANSANYTGALIGYVKDGSTKVSTIENVDISGGIVTGKDHTGGLIGSYIGYNHDKKALLSSLSASSEVNGTSNTGGLVGGIENVSIKTSYAAGKTTGSLDNVGGLVGNVKLNSIIENSYATGDVKGNRNIGGIVGYQYSAYVDSRLAGNIKNAYATGDVEGNSFVGGLVGQNSDGLVDNVYALNGLVKGTDLASVGKTIGSGAGTNTYAISTMSGSGHTNNLNNVIAPEKALQQETFVGFDFDTSTGESVWSIKEGDSLPYLTGVSKQVGSYDPSNGSWVNVDISQNHEPSISHPLHGVTIFMDQQPTHLIDLSNAFSDEDGDTLTYRVVSSHSSVVSSSVQGKTLSLQGLQEGTSKITVTADDGQGGIQSQSFYVNVIQDEPMVEFTTATIEFSSIPNATEYVIVRNGEEIVRIADDGSAAYSYTDIGLTPGTTYVYVVQPVFNDGEGTPIEIGNFETLSMGINVLVDQNVAQANWTSIENAEGYRIDVKKGEQIVSSYEVGRDTTTFEGTMEQTGDYTLEVIPKINGAYGEGQKTYFTIVDDLNTAPSKKNTPDDINVDMTAPTILNGNHYFTDAETPEQLTYTVSGFNSNLIDVEVNGNEMVFNSKGTGQTTITVTATDPQGKSYSLNFKVNAYNTPPVNSEPIPTLYLEGINQSKTINLLDYFEDVDGDQLDVWFVQYPDNTQNVVKMNLINNQLVVTSMREGTTTIEVGVEDGDQTISASFDVVVKSPQNNAPVSKTIPNQILSLDDEALSLDVAQYFSDNDGDTLEYTVQVNNSNVSVENIGSNLSISPNATGSTDITVSVDDGKGGKASRTFTVNITEPVPAAPTNLKAEPLETSVSLTWDNVRYADEYIVKRNGVEIARVTSLSYLDKNLEGSTDYKYEVIAVNEVGTGPVASVDVTTLQKPQETKIVQNIQVSLDDNTAHITWDAFEDASGYRVQAYVKDETTGEFIKDGFARSTTSKSYDYKNLAEGKEYRFEVIPRKNTYLTDSAGLSESVSVVAKVEEPTDSENETPVVNLNIVSNGTTANLSWDNIGDATRYRLQRYVQLPDGSYQREGFAKSITGNTFVDSGLQEGMTYKYELTPRIGYVYDNEKMIEGTVTINQIDEQPAEEVKDDSEIPNVHAIINGSNITLHWDSFSDSTQYRVQRYVKDELGLYKKDGFTKTVNGLSYNDIVDVGKEYKYEIVPLAGNVYVNDYAAEVNVVGLENGSTVTFSGDMGNVYVVQRYVYDQNTGSYVTDGESFEINELSFVDGNALTGEQYKYRFTVK